MKTDTFRKRFDEQVDAYFWHLELEEETKNEQMKLHWRVRRIKSGLEAQFLDKEYNEGLYHSDPTKSMKLQADQIHRELYQQQIKKAI